jgi:hypothetical protein
VVEALLLAQDHYLPIGGWPDGEPRYPYSTAILARCVDADAESVAVVVRRWLKHEEDVVRIRLCGALKLLQAKRPEFVLGLLTDLMASLEMRETSTPGTGTPSGNIVKLFTAGFQRSPEVVDAFLAGRMIRVRAAVQEDIVHVYREQFFARSRDWEERRDRGKRTEITEHESVAIDRLFTWIQDDRIDPGVRWVAAEALEMACEYAPVGVIPRFDELLGYLAIVSELEEPPPPRPRIALPDASTDATLESLEKLNRQQEWGSFKEKLQKCIEALCKANPSQLCDHVCDCLSDATLQHGVAFYGRCVSMLGELGREYSFRSRILPLIMTALMNYNSARIRARATYAMVEMFSYSPMAPPTNMVEAVGLHLVDQYVAVHRAARHAVSRHPSWFKERTASEALMGLEAQLAAYRQKSLEVEEICEAMLALARCNPELTTRTLDLVESVFPTGEALADSGIWAELLRFADPTHDIAQRIAPSLAVMLREHERDRYNHYGYSTRARTFEWFHGLSSEAFEVVKVGLVSAAKELAKRDPWESLHFAGLFARFRAFDCERATLSTAHDALPNEPRYDWLRGKISRLATAAAANATLSTAGCARMMSLGATGEGT